MQRGIFYSNDIADLTSVYTGRIYKAATVELNPGTYIIEYSASVNPSATVNGGLIGMGISDYTNGATYNNQTHIFPRGQVASFNTSSSSSSTNSTSSVANLTTILNVGATTTYYLYIVAQTTEGSAITIYPHFRYLQLPKCFTQS